MRILLSHLFLYTDGSATVGLCFKDNKCSDAGPGDLSVQPTDKTLLIEIATTRRLPRKNLHRRDDLHVVKWNIRTLQDVGVQPLTMLELRKCNMDVTCLSKARIPDSGHSVIMVPGGESCSNLYHSRLFGTE